MAFVPNIVPFLAINNMLFAQRSQSFRSSHMTPSYSKGPSHISNDKGCLPSQVLTRGDCVHGDPKFDLLDDTDILSFGEILDLPDLSLGDPFNDKNDLTRNEDMQIKDKPFNLLFEIYRLGLMHGVGCIGGRTENIDKIISEMNSLTKKFGYKGYEDFDRHFDENENLINKE